MKPLVRYLAPAFQLWFTHLPPIAVLRSPQVALPANKREQTLNPSSINVPFAPKPSFVGKSDACIHPGLSPPSHHLGYPPVFPRN